MPTHESPDIESVHHPKHYNQHPGGIETIEVIRHMTFNVGNAIKYLWRAGLKATDATEQDLRKALWYIQDEIARMRGDRVSGDDVREELAEEFVRNKHRELYADARRILDGMEFDDWSHEQRELRRVLKLLLGYSIK